MDTTDYNTSQDNEIYKLWDYFILQLRHQYVFNDKYFKFIRLDSGMDKMDRKVNEAEQIYF